MYDQLRTALGKYAVLVFRNQNINDDQQIAFSEKFAFEKSLGFDRGGGVTHPEISRIANVDDNNKIRSHGDEKSRYHRATACGILTRLSSQSQLISLFCRAAKSHRSVAKPSLRMRVMLMILGRGLFQALKKKI